MRSEMKEMEPEMEKRRPDVIGGISARLGEKDFITTMYFTSEAEARKAEQAMGENPDEGPQWDELIEEMQFIDIAEPILRSK
jgi:hypothetical protein